MANHDGWQWQGRQDHGWFGHGTRPRSGPAGGGNGRGGGYGSAPATLDERIRALGHAAIAGLPASKRYHPAANFDGPTLERLVGAMRAWVGGLGLDHATFAARFFDRHPSSPAVGHLRRAAEIVAGATTNAEVREATDALAAGMLAVGLDGWSRFLKDAHERAMAAGAAAPLVRPVRDGSSAAGAAAGFLAPTARSGLLARVLGAALRLAGPEVAAVGVLLAAGVFRHPEHVRFTAPRVAGHPDARAVMDWRTNRIAVAVPDPRGGEPRVALFGMRFVVREGHPTYQVLDGEGQVVGRLSQDGELFLMPAGERELARAQAAPEPRPGSGIETRDDDERALVAEMLAQGKSTQEIQAALDARRNRGGARAPTARASGPPPAKPPVVSSRDIAAFRARIRVPKTNTVGVARTNVPGLEGEVFRGASPKVRAEAGLPPAKPGPIKSPSELAVGRNHAEEDIANQFVAAVENAGLKPSDLDGRELVMRIQNEKGVCDTCRWGLRPNSDADPGVLKQLSQRYPGLTIRVVVDNPGPKLRGPARFTVRNGGYVP